ncbi:MAG: D-xylose ABC transporter ATP-binding protein [Spirochaetes bacterium]|nr:MAG: D-xylose ABC transporter ATP-binding protein [Spirochaetota bacterium]
MKENEVILECRNLSKSFEGVQAVREVNLTIRKGSIVGLVGENGAGKSTLVKLIAGEYIRDNGEIIYKENKVFWKNPYEALKAGIGLVHQRPLLISELTGAENIFLGREFIKGFIVDNKKILEKSKQLLKKYPISIEFDLNKKVSDMTAAERQIVEIIKILSFNPEILILDEPTASLTERESKNLFSIIKKLNSSRQLTCIFISHELDEVFELCSEIVVLRNAKKVGNVEKVDFEKDKIIHLIINRDLSEFYPPKSTRKGKCILEINNLTSRTFHHINIKVHEGEIVGLYGLIGAGMSELAESIFGLRDYSEGTIIYNGEEMKNIQVNDMIDKGLYLIPGDRIKNGLFSKFSIGENITITHLNYLIPRFLINKHKENIISVKAAHEFGIVYSNINRNIFTLSGGNQQKVVVAKWLLKDSKLLIFDDPTVGIDIGTKREIYLMLRRLTKEGKGIIFISSEISEMIGIADRIYTMRNGKITEELIGDRINQRNILQNIL